MLPLGTWSVVNKLPLGMPTPLSSLRPLLPIKLAPNTPHLTPSQTCQPGDGGPLCTVPQGNLPEHDVRQRFLP